MELIIEQAYWQIFALFFELNKLLKLIQGKIMGKKGI